MASITAKKGSRVKMFSQRVWNTQPAGHYGWVEIYAAPPEAKVIQSEDEPKKVSIAAPAETVLPPKAKAKSKKK